jgi:hypothetical protein
VSSSPCTRRYPQEGFSRTRRSTSAPIDRTVGGGLADVAGRRLRGGGR